VQPLRLGPGLRADPAPPPRPRDPAPSRLSYRLHRLWLTPLYRALLRVGLPAFALAFLGGLWLADEGRRAGLAERLTELRRELEERPEFMVTLLTVEGASAELAAQVRSALAVELPASSFALDLEALRQKVAAMSGVAQAEARIRPGGILTIRVTERVPAVVWRSPGGLWLLDAEGHRVAPLASRLDRPDLGLVAGAGAEAAVPEALALFAAAEPVASRLRGLVRVGERRWDVVLDRGQRILLPEQGAVAALERAMALALADDLLARDVIVIDLRNQARPTLRLTPAALGELRRMRGLATGASSG
jgi:cell division protein FtsQ